MQETWFNPWPRKIPHAAGQLSLCVRHNYWSSRAPQQQKPLQWKACTPQWREAPCTPQLEKAQAQSKIKWNSKKKEIRSNKSQQFTTRVKETSKAFPGCSSFSSTKLFRWKLCINLKNRCLILKSYTQVINSNLKLNEKWPLLYTVLEEKH